MLKGMFSKGRSLPAGFSSAHPPEKPSGVSLFRWLVLVALLAAFSSGARLHAQTGSITGTVVDPSGAAIPGAKVQVINQATGDLTREAATDAAGVFRALNVPAATYRIKVSARGWSCSTAAAWCSIRTRASA